MTPFRNCSQRGKTGTGRAAAACFGGKQPKIPPILGFLGGFFEGEAPNPQKFFWNCPPKTAFLRGQFFPGYGTVQPEKVLRRCRKPVAVHKTCQQATADSIHKDSIRWSGLQVQRMSDYGNQFLQLDPEQKPSPLGDRFPPHRGKMSRSDKRGNRWRVAPDEGYSGQNAVVLRPHQSPAVTASPDRGKPSCGKLISMAARRAGDTCRLQ